MVSQRSCNNQSLTQLNQAATSSKFYRNPCMQWLASKSLSNQSIHDIQNTILYLSRKGIRICRPTLACFLLASPIAAAASAAAAAADGLRTSFVGVADWEL